MRKRARLIAVATAMTLVLSLAAVWVAAAQTAWPPIKVDLTIQQDGNIFTAVVWVRNEGDFDTDTLNIRGQVPKGAKYVDSWAGSGRGFNKGVFDGNDVGWANAGVKAGGRQGPFVYLFDAAALSPSAGASVAAWVSWAGKAPGNTISKAVNIQTPSPSLDVAVGTPPAVGWVWAVAEIATGAEEVTEALNAHSFFWIFHVVKGSSDLSTTEGKKTLSSGEAVFVPARQEHAHRYAPQSRILVYQLHAADDPVSAFHRGRQIFLSESPIGVKAGFNYRLQEREFSLAPGEQMPECVIGEPNFG
ncbi:MAG: hypothetical protein Q8P59_04230, partial [Dehalococcoidia bacterium]|nr:hypothetical protein [Dehalococcoidia bacterium]